MLSAVTTRIRVVAFPNVFAWNRGGTRQDALGMGKFLRQSGVLLALAGLLTTVLAVIAIVAPNIAAAMALGVISAGLFAAAAFRIIQETKAANARDLEIDAHSLAGEIRALFSQDMKHLTSEQIIHLYNHRYASQLRRIALRFREQDVPQTDRLFTIADSGVQTFMDVFSASEALDRLANQLHNVNYA